MHFRRLVALTGCLTDKGKWKLTYFTNFYEWQLCNKVTKSVHHSNPAGFTE